MVKNYMESLVDVAQQKELAEHPERYGSCCQCAACLAAARAVALNHLKPFYVTCIAGEVYGEYRSKELQNSSDVLMAVVKGLEEVGAAGCVCSRPQPGVDDAMPAAEPAG